VIFPLPRGNATVILKPTVGLDGELILASGGKEFGDPGFYFLLNDSKEVFWAQYIPSFTERIVIRSDRGGDLNAKHSLTFWGLRVAEIHYQIRLSPVS
jgi:hypothetical protein